MNLVARVGTDFALFFTSLIGAILLTRYILDRVIAVSLTDLIEAAIAALIIALGRTLLGKN
ncbi:MAG: hypothetical protein CL820_08765 [Croceicoccus sp.]|jgi:hypothetical protein|uniref:Uncharacterized protein n=1 Tax=Croceicoccus marinus TaxID=450378 RepID=A0A1Z1F9U4_9SPHN|nr:hypothetical protein [Croceicoccus marinus]ARU15571.1 hypothetical protein A9D14_04485 [Croceicoccus marinus]MAF29277.1 hypothetical protein [Croceicoccus sp.]MAL25968.1 hypothetical protein [Croceicoccus sp.]QNE04523.1 hypothetical protein H4O24_11160 [Croceicoccus marinus]|tara:strand:+ start:14211 stop:14393 length:183 start_codon:yes stop_codon:yes gene_type:complete